MIRTSESDASTSSVQRRQHETRAAVFSAELLHSSNALLGRLGSIDATKGMTLRLEKRFNNVKKLEKTIRLSGTNKASGQAYNILPV